MKSLEGDITGPTVEEENCAMGQFTLELCPDEVSPGPEMKNEGVGHTRDKNCPC